MADSLKTLAALTLFVEDPQQSKAFYGGVFEVEPLFEDAVSVALRFENVVLNLLQRGAAVDELLGPTPAADAGASFLLTVAVEDVDATCAELRARGASIEYGPIDRPWGIRTASFADPDGYLWELAADS
ncbi:MAG TPA: VOC family protein [Gaiellaceae bacterium]|nr:VOC family protein [Gaiellaceae bacterium]